MLRSAWWVGAMRRRGALVAHRMAMIACVMAVGLSVAGVGTPAHADPFPAAHWPDSTDHWYCFESGITTEASYYHDSMSYLDDRTAMSDHYTSTCGASTDVAFVRNDGLEALGLPARGATQCTAWSGFAICDKARIDIN